MTGLVRDPESDTWRPARDGEAVQGYVMPEADDADDFDEIEDAINEELVRVPAPLKVAALVLIVASFALCAADVALFLFSR